MKLHAHARRGLGQGLVCLAAAAALSASACAPVDDAQEIESSSQGLARSLTPPGGLSAAQVPQFVAVTFDDNFGGDGMDWANSFFAGKTNPAGTGNAATFDGTPVRTSFFHNSTYIDGQQSRWQTAFNAGNELCDHTVNHGDGLDYAIAQWTPEIENCRNTLASRLGTTTSNIKGFRSPYLHYNDNLFTVLRTQSPAFTYDTSIMGCWATAEGPTNCPWPYTMDNGSADADAIVSKWPNRNVRSVSSQPGLWEVPVSVVFVPPDSLASTYGFTSGLRSRVGALLGGASNPNFFEESTGKLVGMDITMFLDGRMKRDEVLATLKYTLDQRLAGNRAPMIFVGHTHVYQTWNVPADVETEANRKGAIQDFVNYALSKPEVRMRNAIDIVNWMNNPVALGSTGGNTDPDRTEGGSVSTSSGTLCNASTETADKAYDNTNATKWCINVAPTSAAPLSTAYDFAGSDAYIITSYKVTTANDQAARDPKDWTLQGCPNASCSATSDTGWVTLDTRTAQFAGAARGQTNTYSFSNTTAYQKYRLRMTANNGASGTTQVAEVQMFGNLGSVCVPTTCAAQGKNCNSIPDGCGGTLSCGSCSAPQTCGGGGTANVCGGGCVPTTCAAQGKNCDSISDGCGGTLSCGSCSAPMTCGGGGTANVCGGGSGSCSPTVSSYTQGKCNATAVYNGKLYKCISQAVNVNGETTGCGVSGVYCSVITPTDAAWGTTAWQFVQSCQ